LKRSEESKETATGRVFQRDVGAGEES